MKTIGYETGMQNMTLAFNVINLSFSPVSVAVQYSTYSLIYAMAEMIDFTLMSFVYLSFYRCKEKRSVCHQCSHRCSKHKEKQEDDNIVIDEKGKRIYPEVFIEEVDQVNLSKRSYDSNNIGDLNSAYLSEVGLQGRFKSSQLAISNSPKSNGVDHINHI